MAQKQLNGRITLKHDLEVNWVAAAQRSNFTPNPGEVIIYDPDENHAQARIKIGDGVRNVEELPFYAGSWNDLTDKPFGEESGKHYFIQNLQITSNNLGTQIPLDENLLTRENDSPMYIYLQVDDKIYPMRLTGWDNIEETWYMGYTWQEHDGQGFDGMCAEARFQSNGNNYFTFFNTDFIDSNISLWENYGVEIKTLDSKFIGDDIARVSEVPSFEDLDTVSATAAAAINEVSERVDEVVEAKADWNQNNETAPDYIKNRTHWVERATEILLPERTVEESYTQLSELDGVEFWLSNTMDFTYNTLIITFDGIKYELDAFAYDSRPHWGNSSLIADNTNVIDVPFLLETAWGLPEGQFFGNEIPVWYINYDSSVIGNHHTIKIETINGELVHKLDEKFIPDTIARKEDLNNIDLSNFYSKSEIDNMEFITVDDIDTICGR